ncbi:MAG: hypothetical protein ACI4PD_04165 [Butyricicoccus sp.]
MQIRRPSVWTGGFSAADGCPAEKNAWRLGRFAAKPQEYKIIFVQNDRNKEKGAKNEKNCCIC